MLRNRKNSGENFVEPGADTLSGYSAERTHEASRQIGNAFVEIGFAEHYQVRLRKLFLK